MNTQKAIMITAALHEPQIHKPADTSSAVSGDAPPTPRIFRSKLPDIDIPNHLPLHTYCFEKLSSVSDKPCLIVGSTGKSYSYGETHLICRRVAAGLYKIGIRKGDVIMILLQNSAEFVFSFMGASMIGAVSTTANPFYTSQEIYKQLKSSGAKLIITQSQYVDKLRNLDEETKIGQDLTVITTEDPPPENCLPFSMLTDETNPQPEESESVHVGGDDAAALPFSSGTTGLPKGVVLTHKSLITSVAQQVDGENPNIYLDSNDVVLCVLPLFHIYSLNSVLLNSIRSGAAVLLMHKFEIGALLDLIQRHKVTMAALVPPLVIALAKNPAVNSYDLSSVRLVLSGAAPLSKDLQDNLRRRLPQAILGQVYVYAFFISTL